jgi:hypothetical protein
MTTPFGDIAVPALVGVNLDTNTYKAIRSLTKDDLAGLKQARETYGVAKAPSINKLYKSHVVFQDHGHGNDTHA